MRLVVHADAASFLTRARPWLEREEDANNLVLSIAEGIAHAPGPTTGPEAPFFATVEDGDEVVGCSFRTPPHKLVLTSMPVAGARLVGEAAVEQWASVRATLGPADVARAAAEAWVALRGGRVVEGMKQRIHRLDRVSPPVGVPGRMRPAVEAELPMLATWGEGFATDAGAEFRTSPEAREAWVRARRLFLWEDGTPVTMAVATGATRRGVRVGYVYTPPERRRRGYATALVAALSARLLEEGFAFCVLYTDLANPTSNAIYARVGYRPVLDVEDVWIEGM